MIYSLLERWKFEEFQRIFNCLKISHRFIIFLWSLPICAFICEEFVVQSTPDLRHTHGTGSAVL
jgi:hypothetical protein